MSHIIEITDLSAAFAARLWGRAGSFAWRLRRCTGCVSIPGAAVYEPGGQKDDAGKLEFFCRIPLNFNSYFGMLLQEFKVFS